jgi:predicted hydrocarbon binding protein
MNRLMKKENMMEMQRKYVFNWELLGDIAAARPNLGPNTRVEVYRMMQFCFRDVLEQQLGTEKTDKIFYDAGKLAGTHFYRNLLKPADNLNDFVQQLQEVLKEMGIGVLRVEKANAEKGEFILTVSEDLDCSGLPELDYEICKYDEGFFAAIMESFTGKKFTVREVDCWCTGDRTCRFSATVTE